MLHSVPPPAPPALKNIEETKAQAAAAPHAAGGRTPSAPALDEALLSAPPETLQHCRWAGGPVTWKPSAWPVAQEPRASWKALRGSQAHQTAYEGSIAVFVPLDRRINSLVTM